MPKIIQIPFPGFYDSLYSSEVDSIVEREAEHFAEQEGETLEASDFFEILSDVTDYHKCFEGIASEYVSAFDSHWSDELGFKLGLEFETMKSPREYNFETDRLFAFIEQSVLDTLWAESKADDHASLIHTITERHTSRSGFISFYSSTFQEWLEKPLTEWDHNELGTLLIAVMRLHCERDEWEMDVFDRMSESCFYAHSDAVDWPAFDAKAAALRAERAAPPPPYRCPDTTDMFPKG